MNPEKMGKFIAQLRKEKGYSQEQLANLIPVTRQAVSKWELGKSVPDSSVLIILAKIFEVDVNDLLAGEHTTKEKQDNTTLKLYDERNKKNRFLKGLIILIVLLVLGFLTYYFVNSYNSIKVYTITYDSNDIAIKNGILVITKNKSYFQLGNIVNNQDKTITGLEVYYTDKDKKDVIIYSCDECGINDLHLFNYYGYNNMLNEKDIKYISKNLKLKLTYDDNNTETINLKLKQDFANNKLIFSQEKEMLDNNQDKVKEDEKDKLLKIIETNFKKDYDGYIFKKNKISANYVDNILNVKYENKAWIFDFDNEILTYQEEDSGLNIIYDYSVETCLTENCENINEIEEEMFELLEKK